MIKEDVVAMGQGMKPDISNNELKIKRLSAFFINLG